MIKLNLKVLINRIRSCKNDIDISEVEEIIKTNANTILLDVRSRQEFLEGHLDGAINIPLFDLEKYCLLKLKDKNKIVIVYCQSGIRSKKAIKVLNSRGFKNLYNLKNGLDGI